MGKNYYMWYPGSEVAQVSEDILLVCSDVLVLLESSK